MNDILLIDKEAGWTSNDVVRFLKGKLNPEKKDENGKKIKKILKQDEKKFRIGHSGTLDPFATGLLLIMLNDGTKKFSELQNLKKEYIAEIEFGIETDTYDVDGKIVHKNLEFLSSIQGGELREGVRGFENNIIKLLQNNFTGKIFQIPPKYSAIKVDGKRLYQLVYKGKNILPEVLEKKKREVEIYENEILSLKKNILKIRFLVSSGTYIRSIAYDLGKLTGYGAYLKSLRRTKIGEYSLDTAMGVEDVKGTDKN